jgi:hypothetical protein
MAQTFTVTSRRDGTTSFDSDLSDAQVQAALAAVRGDFAASLLRQWGRLSTAQLAWAHKLALQVTAPAAAPAGDSQLAGLFAPFDHARQGGRKRLAIRTPDAILKPSKCGDYLYVSDPNNTEPGYYGSQPRYLGKVSRQGVTNCSAEVADNLRLIAADPLSAAVAYGRLTGSCSICARTLTDPVSIERGIGPICADNYGLL